MRRAPFLLAVVLASWGLLACDGGPRGPAWGGNALPVAERVENPSAEALRAADLAPLAAHHPRAFLAIGPGEWSDSLFLVEFADDLAAYAAFQEIALSSSSSTEDVSAGTTVRGGRVCFRRGRWVGVVPGWNWRGTSWFDTALALPEQASTGTLPPAFGSMLHKDRLPGSERVLTREVLGGAASAPALAVALDCHGDTAWLYATLPGRPAVATLRALGWRKAPGDEDLFLREIPDLPPASLRFSQHGTVAVEGCFDSNLTNNWIKNQYSGLKIIKNSLKALNSVSFD
jgi:hypothetical protein